MRITTVELPQTGPPPRRPTFMMIFDRVEMPQASNYVSPDQFDRDVRQLRNTLRRVARDAGAVTYLVSNEEVDVRCL